MTRGEGSINSKVELMLSIHVLKEPGDIDVHMGPDVSLRFGRELEKREINKRRWEEKLRREKGGEKKRRKKGTSDPFTI